jgi:hypothetical protein
MMNYLVRICKENVVAKFKVQLLTDNQNPEGQRCFY